jgi:lysyl-tRNA synthetase class 1
VDFVSNTDLYESGEFEAVTRDVLANREQARETLAQYQNKVDEEYVPFFARCGNCGQLTETITDVDLDAGTVSYRCTDAEAGDDTIDGCGHEGTTDLRDGKLPWRFEWPAQWKVLGVDFEPFGKDHAEGSWPSGVDIARNVVDVDPPVGMVYEWFTLEGEALSSSEGNIVTVGEVLDILEPEVFRYFFGKEPLKQRDFSIERIDQLVDEFDRLEAVYFDEVDAEDSERELAERLYPLLVEDLREDRIRIPYTFAAVLGMTDDPELREEIARREGHINDDAPEWAVEEALGRVKRAREWARITENAFDYELKRAAMPEVDFDDATAAALDDLASFVADGHDGEAIQAEIFDLAEEYDIPVGEFFGAGYRLFFDDDEGPKLGSFLARLDEEFVVGRLRRER